MLSKSTFPPWPAEQPNRTIIDLQVFPTKQVWPSNDAPAASLLKVTFSELAQAKANDEQLQKDVTAAIKKVPVRQAPSLWYHDMTSWHVQAVDAAQKGYDDELKKATTTAASSARSSYDDMIKESFASYIKTGKDRGQ
jgi:hypothetical protein